MGRLKHVIAVISMRSETHDYLPPYGFSTTAGAMRLTHAPHLASTEVGAR